MVVLQTSCGITESPWGDAFPDKSDNMIHFASLGDT